MKNRFYAYDVHMLHLHTQTHMFKNILLKFVCLKLMNLYTQACLPYFSVKIFSRQESSQYTQSVGRASQNYFSCGH